MADFAGAAEAIERHLAEQWSATPITRANEAAPEITDPVSGEPVPWIFCEIVTDDAAIAGFGLRSSNPHRVTGAVEIDVFTPAATGAALGRQYAVALGELFRNRRLYDAEPSAYVWTRVPVVGRTQAARSEQPSGAWWCTSVSIPFEFYHRA